MDIDSPTQTFYAGEFRHAIDEKNRLTIPSRWRRVEGEEFILLPEPNQQHLLVMAPEEFARMSSRAASHQNVSPRDHRIFSRHLHARAEHAVADKQGRLVLPDHICKELGLKGEVALVGGQGRFEIWNVSRWKRAHEEEKATYQHVAGLVGL